ncbi:MAG: drug/metabolite transporter (DMT)-like permease [Bermanella sp.]|jgi:drug/metabolite transporter (DMT)-like permease
MAEYFYGMLKMYYLFPLLAVLIWAGNTIINKLTVGVIHPAEIGFYRWVFAAMILTPFLLGPTIKAWPSIRPYLGKVFVLGSLGMAVFQSLAYFAADKTSAVNMGIVLSLMPIMALVLSMVALGQKLTYGALFGSVLSFMGVLWVVTQGDVWAITHQGINFGDALMLMATFAYAVYSALLKRWQIPFSAMQLLYLQVLVAIVVQFPLFLVSPSYGLNSDNLPLVLYACLFASIAAPLAWMSGVKYLGPSRNSIFFNLMPILTAIIAMLALGEHLHVYHYVGGGITLIGVVLSERWKKGWSRNTSSQPS